jgi:type IV fimbrial biogenesis protein FimT
MWSGPPQRSTGFTLVELMVTVAVLAIVAALAVPSFTTIMHRNRLTTAANEMVGALQGARMEAIRRNRRAVLCPSTDGLACNGDDWTRLIVFVDADLDGAVDAGELVRDAQLSRAGTGITASSANNRIWFGSDGRVSTGAAATAAISVVSSKLPSTENGRFVEAAVSRISVCTTAGTSTTCQR